MLEAVFVETRYRVRKYRPGATAEECGDELSAGRALGTRGRGSLPLPIQSRHRVERDMPTDGPVTQWPPGGGSVAAGTGLMAIRLGRGAGQSAAAAAAAWVHSPTVL